jgi:uncharacterized coiled-coil protein SlyX
VKLEEKIELQAKQIGEFNSMVLEQKGLIVELDEELKVEKRQH